MFCIHRARTMSSGGMGYRLSVISGTTSRPNATTRPGRWAIRPRKAKKGSSRIPASRNEVGGVAEIETPREEEPEQPAEIDWDENEPSPHQGEEGQEESESE